MYNDCWHGFWVRSWWLRVLWQAVTLWLIKRGLTVRRGWPVEQVCNRKETTWYENHTVRFRQSVQSESRVEPGILSRSEALMSSLTRRLARESKRWHSLAPGGRYGSRTSPLSKYMSLHLSLNNKLSASFKNTMREIYSFIKKCDSFRSLKFVHYLW